MQVSHPLSRPNAGLLTQPFTTMARCQYTGQGWWGLALHSWVGQRAGLGGQRARLRGRGPDCLSIASEGAKQASSICFVINEAFDLAKMNN